MKKHLATVLVLILAALALCGGASANSWGLTGTLYRVVEQSKAWDNYTSLSSQADCFAVMCDYGDYHNALFHVDKEDRLHVYTTAVYQPKDKRAVPDLTLEGGWLTIRYGENESYTFCETDGGYELLQADIGDFYVEVLAGDEGYDWHYAAGDTEDDVVFPVAITLDTFNISLFPHSCDEVRDINHMHALFDSGRHCLGGGAAGYSPDSRGELQQPKMKGTAPVYSAPYGRKAWRAAKGKAAVGTNGSMWVLTRYTNENNEAYACIRYDVSERTQRIGWALCRDIGLPETQANEQSALFMQVPVRASAETFLTDDPDVSQYAQFTVPKGTELTCLGLYNDYYAYVAATEKNGKLTGKGSTVWGFVPVRDLQPVSGKQQAKAMKQAAGNWYLDAGGSMAGDILVLNADGSFVSGMAGGPDEEAAELEGVWSVTEYDPAEGLYWNDPAYQITLLYRNGSAKVCGLTFTDDGLSLTSGEGGGAYIRSDIPQETEEE